MDIIQRQWIIQNFLSSNTKSVGKFTDAASSVFFKHSDNRVTKISENTRNYNKAEYFIDSLPLPLRQDASKALCRQHASITSVDSRIGHLEISSRSQLLSLTQDLTDALNRATVNVTVDELTKLQTVDTFELPSLLSDCEEALEELLLFIRSVADLCICIITLARDVESTNGNDEISKYNFTGMGTPLMGRLPFILLEDVVETVPSHFMQLVWAFGPSVWLHQWCREIPNTLSILDRQHDTVGPLFTSSTSHFVLIRCCNKLLKRIGKIVPPQQSSLMNKHTLSSAAFTGQVALILASVLPLSDPSVAHTSGASQNERLGHLETVEQFQVRQSLIPSLSNTVPMNFERYSSFWSVQQVFADPSSILPQGKAAAANTQEWMSRLGSFLVHLRSLLDTFKALPLSHESFAHHAPMHISIDDKQTMKLPDSTAYKYVMDSTLLDAQLQDASIRMNILTQILITCSYIQSQLNLTPTLPIKIKTVLINHSTNVQNILEESKDLLSQTAPNGKEYLKIVTWILNEREPMWRHWKHNKCIPPIEDMGLLHLKKKSTKIIRIEQPQEESRAGSNKEMSMQAYYANAINSFSFSIDVNKDLPTLSASLKKFAPSVDDHLKDYLEALDPEAGIEEEYHPKNDHVWKWRAMRLLNKKCFHYFEKNLVRKTDGDFEGLVRMIWAKEKGLNLPGEENFLHRCQLDNIQLPDEFDDDLEELKEDTLRARSKGNQLKNTSPSRNKDAESFSSGEIDENEISNMMDEPDDANMNETSESIVLSHPNNECPESQRNLSDPVVDQVADSGVKSTGVDGNVDESFFLDDVKVETTTIETAANVNDLEATVGADIQRLATTDEPAPIIDAKDTIEHVTTSDGKELSSTVAEGPTDAVKDDTKETLQCVTKDTRNVSHDSRKRKLDSTEAEVSVERPLKRVATDETRSKHGNNDNNRNIPRAGQHQNQRRNEPFPRTSTVPITSNSHQHRGNHNQPGDQYHANRNNNSHQNVPPAQPMQLPPPSQSAPPPITSNSHQHRGNHNRPGDQYHANRNNNINSHQNVPPAQPMQLPPPSQSAPPVGNRRDGNRGYGQNVPSQSSSNMANRRPGNPGNRGYGEGDRRSGGYNRPR